MYDEANGFILGTPNGTKYFLPNEILIHILSFVDARSLRENCVLVCKNWNNVIKYNVWKIIAERKLNKKLIKLPWTAYQNLCVSDVFDKNLILNSCGENNNMNHWNLLTDGGDKWLVESKPQGCEPLPEREFGETTSCFATSYYSCSKDQTIDLLKAGVSAQVMDELQPRIYISEWIGTRFDCGCIYEIIVTLLNSKKEMIKRFHHRFSEEQFQGGTWHKVEHSFENYGPGIRYVYFFHGGQDTLFWAGHYGSKMSGATVKVMFEFTALNEKSEINKQSNTTEDENDDLPDLPAFRNIRYPENCFFMSH